MSPYTAEPQNFTASDALQAVRTPALRGYLVDHSVPWRAVDLTTGDALPRDAQDRDEINYLADIDNGTIWRLVYLTKTGYWYYIGGSAMYAQVLTSETTASITYTALATAGPSITVPLAGDYNIHHGFGGANNTGDYSVMSYDVGATVAADAWAAYHQSSGVNHFTSVSRKYPHTIAAGDAVVSKYRGASGGTATLLDRWISITPTRVY